MRIGQTATASLVSLGAPDRVNRRSPIAQHARVSVDAIVRRVARGQSKSFDNAIGQSNAQQRRCWVQRSGEDIRVKRKRAGVFKHDSSGRGRIDSATQLQLCAQKKWQFGCGFQMIILYKNVCIV